MIIMRKILVYRNLYLLISNISQNKDNFDI